MTDSGVPHRRVPVRRSPCAGGRGRASLALIGEYGHRQITHAHRNDFRDDPARWGMGPAEEIDLTARDGIRLHSWLFRSPTPTRR